MNLEAITKRITENIDNPTLEVKVTFSDDEGDHTFGYAQPTAVEDLPVFIPGAAIPIPPRG